MDKGSSKMAARATAGAAVMVKATGNSNGSREGDGGVQWARSTANWQ